VVHGAVYAPVLPLITLKLDFLAFLYADRHLAADRHADVLFFGWLSDRIGRLKIIMAGCLIAAVLLPAVRRAHPLRESGPRAFQAKTKISVTADTEQCNFHIFVGRGRVHGMHAPRTR